MHKYGTLPHMRYMGIDFGSKRVGVALSDESGRMAFPHTVLPNDGSLFSTLEQIIEKEGVEIVVVGHSLNGSQEENPIHHAVEAFIGDLTLKTGLPIHLEPEQYTTMEAMRTQGRTSMTDASAAAIILNSYLTKHT